jgi:putative heme-binding domain-containing protein
MEYAQIFGQIDEPRCIPVLLQVVASSNNDAVRSAALTGLQAYDESSIGREVARLHDKLLDDSRAAAQSLLASRRDWAIELIQAVETGAIAQDTVSQGTLHKLLFHNDPELKARINKLWGDVQSASSDAMRAEVQRLSELIAGSTGNPYRGKQLFLSNCAKCHVLFTDGGKIGPDLTTYKRDDLRGMLMNIVNPSLEIREGFENFVVFTDDGRTLNGFIADQDNRVVVLKGADGQTLIIPRAEVDEMQAIPRSIMPEGILKPFNPQQVRDLFAYLRATQPLP